MVACWLSFTFGFSWICLLVVSLNGVRTQFIAGAGGAGYGGRGGIGYGLGYGAGYGNGYGSSLGSSTDNAVRGAQQQALAATTSTNAEKGACQTYVCTEWYDNELLHSKAKESNLWGQVASKEGSSEYLNAASGSGAYGAGSQTQGFFDSFGWGPLIGQAAFGYGQGASAFIQGYGGGAQQQAVGKAGSQSSVTAFKNQQANASSKKCVSYRCGFTNQESAQLVLPEYFMGYGGRNAGAAYGNVGEAGYGGVGYTGAAGLGDVGVGYGGSGVMYGW
eukprot:TRINITY_DN23247_c0_g1_i1.p1 TRINITY_DN23247_c0_g1~~TRINITY_DN23247_c0_g1_i1.p1  ORF type:complete len:276 (-),score=9.61 TRINITY_DN23247_c0_g1_i1:4-831(-)